jgi:hypothetical protein
MFHFGHLYKGKGCEARDGVFQLLRNRESIESKESIPPAYVTCAGIFKQSMRARNRVRIGWSYWPAWLHSLAELVPWNRFLGYIKVKKIRALAGQYDNPIPTRFLALIDCSEIPALTVNFWTG